MLQDCNWLLKQACPSCVIFSRETGTHSTHLQKADGIRSFRVTFANPIGLHARAVQICERIHSWNDPEMEIASKSESIVLSALTPPREGSKSRQSTSYSIQLPVSLALCLHTFQMYDHFEIVPWKNVSSRTCSSCAIRRGPIARHAMAHVILRFFRSMDHKIDRSISGQKRWHWPVQEVVTRNL